jgi:hypothetical protein
LPPLAELTEMEKAVLQALADACNYSLGAHPPVEAVTRSFAGNLKGDVKKNLRNLRKRGYCQCHPTHGGQTWQLTSQGLAVARGNLV